MIIINDDGYIIIQRSEYLYRNGECDKKAEGEMGDGDIIGRINPEAYKDIQDAQTIINWLVNKAKNNE